MCQVSSFNADHEKCIQGCNCCKSKDSAAAVSATLAERERILVLLIRNKVVRWDSVIANKLVFINCNTLDVEYLKEEI